jgi:hypothetical protein
LSFSEVVKTGEAVWHHPQSAAHKVDFALESCKTTKQNKTWLRKQLREFFRMPHDGRSKAECLGPGHYARCWESCKNNKTKQNLVGKQLRELFRVPLTTIQGPCALGHVSMPGPSSTA